MKKIAIFDFDGTLSKGYISMKFLEYLHKKNTFSVAEYKNQIKMLREVKSGKLSYEDWCLEWGISWANGLKGQKKETINQYAKEFFKKFKRNIYPASYKIINLLKKRGYYTICLSVGAGEVISLACNGLGIDEEISTRLEIKNGKYAGKILTKVHIPGEKRGEVMRILKRKNLDKRASYGFGDSESDICFLELVENPFLLNASDKIKNIGKERGWKIIGLDKIGNKQIEQILNIN